MPSSRYEPDASRDQRLRSPARLLLLIEQRSLAGVVSRALHDASYVTRVALAALAGWSPHLLVLDLDAAGKEMLQRCAAATPQSREPAIVALTRCADLRFRLTAFERGVDDILTVPFSPDELVARITAVMRRTYHDAAVFAPQLRLGDLVIDIRHRRVCAGGAELHLTSIEQSLLYLLAANAGRVLTRDQILDDLWGADYQANSNVVDRHIRNLRVKLQRDAQRPRYIVTVPGRGYRFLVPSPDALSPKW